VKLESCHRTALSAFHRTGSGEIGFSHLYLLYDPVVSAFEAMVRKFI
jgi:hypothetical protein